MATSHTKVTQTPLAMIELVTAMYIFIVPLLLMIISIAFIQQVRVVKMLEDFASHVAKLIDHGLDDDPLSYVLHWFVVGETPY